jgi:hypothetical protein
MFGERPRLPYGDITSGHSGLDLPPSAMSPGVRGIYGKGFGADICGERRQLLSGGIRSGSEWSPVLAGPTVRIHFPPAVSQVRT